MISFQEGEEQWLWVERRKEWLLKKISTTTMFQEGEEEWLRLERQRQPKEEEKNCLKKKKFLFFFKKEEIICMFGWTLLGQALLQSRYIRFIVTEASNK